MLIYFVRHGESEANVLNVFSNRGTKHPLTPRGREQVQTLARQLAGVRFGEFYSSPVLRAIESAEILSRHLHIPYQMTEALREYDVGIYEGRCDAEGWDRYIEVRDAWLKHRRWQERMEGGECFDDIRARFMPLIDSLRAQPPDTAAALLLGHGGTFGCMLPLIFSNIDFEFVLTHGLPHTAYVVGELGERNGVCLQWGDVVLPAVDAER